MDRRVSYKEAPQMVAYVYAPDYEIEIGRCSGGQVWYFQVWGSSAYPWHGEGGYATADEAIDAALRYE